VFDECLQRVFFSFKPNVLTLLVSPVNYGGSTEVSYAAQTLPCFGSQSTASVNSGVPKFHNYLFFLSVMIDNYTAIMFISYDAFGI